MNKQKEFVINGSDDRPMLCDLTAQTDDIQTPLLIFAHGFTGFKDWGSHDLMANFFSSNGIRFLKFNFSHNGTTIEQPTEFVDLEGFSQNTFTKEIYDLENVVDYVFNAKLLNEEGQLYLMGHSFGGGIAILEAAKDLRIKKLVTLASVGDFGSLWSDEAKSKWQEDGIVYRKNMRTGQDLPIKVNMLNDLEEHPTDLDILSKAKDITQPWLIFHGDNDTSVPLHWAQKLKEAQPKAELCIIEGANHTFGSSHPYYGSDLPVHLKLLCEVVLKFLQNQ